jgi:hypothetical protein
MTHDDAPAGPLLREQVDHCRARAGGHFLVGSGAPAAGEEAA